MLWSKFWNHFQRNNSHESFRWSGWIKRDVNLDYLGFPIFWAAIIDLLITMKYWIFLFLVSCQEKFPPVLLNIIFLGSAVQEIESWKNVKFSFSFFDFSFFLFFFFFLSFVLKTYSTLKRFTAWKVSKYRVISALYFPVFSPNTEIYGPEITPYLDTFHTVVPIFSIWCLQLHAHAPAHAPLFWCV